MGVDVTIRAKGLFGKPPELKDILHPGIGYGTLDDAFRLSLPAGVLEIQNFYRLVERICGLMGTKRFVRDEETVGLDEFFHEMQNMDAYYTKANAYLRQDGSIFGVYALSAGVKTILPFKPGFL
ncbi:MAG: DUF4299 domain-containing protein [Dorea sp.]|nr:DUF4299 domain-containing protein [Dorea sp.]